MTKHLQSSFLLAIFCVVPSLLAPVPAIAGPISPGVSFTGTELGFTDQKSRMIGWQFTVGADPIKVTELGFQDFGRDGLAESHQVGIWQLSNQVLIDSVVVPSGTSGTLSDFFRYAQLASPPTLLPGTSYVISGFDGGNDPSVWDADIGGKWGPEYSKFDVTGFSVNPAITIGDAGTAHGPFQGSFGFPVPLGVPDGRRAIMGPNLRFEVVPEVVPEPTTIALLGSGLIGLAGVVRRRKRKLTA